MISFDVWRERFAGYEPLGFLLRDALRGRWVRFHSLPRSKRYPDDEGDYAILLHRHNTILGELASPGSEVVVLSTEYSPSPAPASREAVSETLDPDATPWHTVPMHEIEGDWHDGPPTFWHLYASCHAWRPGLFDPIVRLVANDELDNVLFVGADRGWVVTPYDGGMDVIAPSWVDRDRLRAAHADWLSPHPSEL